MLAAKACNDYDAPMKNTAPSFIRPRAGAVRLKARGKWLLLLISVLLVGLLTLQVLIADRARLAQNAQWRPRIAMLCSWLACELPAWRETTGFKVLSREIRPHPTAPGALLVTATFRNDAAFEQAWPIVQLAMTDLDGGRIGLRRFQPREYLGSQPSTERIAVGQSASFALEIIDPGNRAVAFEFEFH